MEDRVRKMMSERTLVLIKPDGVIRGLAGQILQRFEQVGLKIVGLKMLRATLSQLEKHFPQSDQWVEEMGKKSLATYQEYSIDPIEILGTNNPMEIGTKIKEWNCLYLTMGPVVAMVFQGVHAIDVVRKIIGHTLPYRANPGTIRGDFSINSPDLANMVGSACKNLIHASGNKEEAEAEIQCWFSPDELVSWERVDESLMFLGGEGTKLNNQAERVMTQTRSELQEKLDALKETEPRKAAEIAYVLARLSLDAGDGDQATKFGQESIRLLDQCEMQTTEQCAAHYVTLAGIALPSYFHQDVVRDRLKSLNL